MSARAGGDVFNDNCIVQCTVFTLCTTMVRRDIRFEAKRKRIFCFEANKTGFIHLFRIEATWRISHVKRIRTEANTVFLSK